MPFNFLSSKKNNYNYLGLPSVYKYRRVLNSIGPGGLIFSALSTTSSYRNLDTRMIINGETVDAMFVYRGHEATTSSWIAHIGEDLTITGSGADVTVDRYTPFTNSDDRAVKINSTTNTKFYKASNNTFGNIGLDDFVFESIVKYSHIASRIYFSKYSNIGSTIGYGFGGSFNRPTITINQIGAQTNPTSLLANHWVHLMGFGDRSGNYRWYINGDYQTQTSIVAAQTSSADSNSPFLIAGYNGLSNAGAGEISWIAGWHSPEMCGGTVEEQNAIAAERFAKASGFYATYAGGIAYPIINTRNNPGYLDACINEETGERRLFLMSPQWLRLVKRKKEFSNEYMVGYLSEPATSNRLLQSETFNINWASGSLVVTGASSTSPNGDITSFGLISNTDNVQHELTQSVGLTGTSYVFSIYAKAGDTNWLCLKNDSINSGSAWFNLSSGQLGTRHSGLITSSIETYGADWYRCYIRFSGSESAHSLKIIPSLSDNSFIFTGDNSTINTHIFGAQVETGSIASSYIYTTTAIGTRGLDNLQYDSVGNTPASTIGTLEIKGATKNALGVYDYGGFGFNSNYITDFLSSTSSLGVRAVGRTNNVGHWDILASGSGSTVNDGILHTFKQTFAPNEIKFYLDGVLVGTDSVGTPNVLQSRIYPGQSAVATRQTSGLVSDIKIYDIIT